MDKKKDWSLAYCGEAAAHVAVGNWEAGLIDGLLEDEVDDALETLLCVDGELRHLLHQLVEHLRRQLVQDAAHLTEEVLKNTEIGRSIKMLSSSFTLYRMPGKNTFWTTSNGWSIWTKHHKCVGPALCGWVRTEAASGSIDVNRFLNSSWVQVCPLHCPWSSNQTITSGHLVILKCNTFPCYRMIMFHLPNWDISPPLSSISHPLSAGGHPSRGDCWVSHLSPLTLTCVLVMSGSSTAPPPVTSLFRPGFQAFSDFFSCTSSTDTFMMILRGGGRRWPPTFSIWGGNTQAQTCRWEK